MKYICDRIYIIEKEFTVFTISFAPKNIAIRRAQMESLVTFSTSDLPKMDFSTIVEATNNFSQYNKLGEGGFGPVYKVTFPYFNNSSWTKIILSSSLIRSNIDFCMC
jgi:hypothetical protein